MCPTFTSRLPDPVPTLTFFVAIRKSSIYDFFKLTNAQPYTFTIRFIYSECDLIHKRIQRRLNDSNMIAICIYEFVLS